MEIVVVLLIVVGLVLFDLAAYLYGSDSREPAGENRLLGIPERSI